MTNFYNKAREFVLQNEGKLLINAPWPVSCMMINIINEIRIGKRKAKPISLNKVVSGFES
jgi:hypothetical protein